MTICAPCSDCWHRPGRIRNGVWTCRYCGVAIEFCPCTDTTSWRKIDDHCVACQGSGWVAIVRGRIAKFEEAMEIYG